jgi:hypothetical protein
VSGDRWGDTRADRDALDKWLTTDPRDGLCVECRRAECECDDAPDPLPLIPGDDK